MNLQKRNLIGLEYLSIVTDLLHNIRLYDDFAGLYEAADLQWWWREDDASCSENQTFWFDRGSQPVACLLIYKGESQWEADFILYEESNYIEMVKLDSYFQGVYSFLDWSSN